MNDIRGDFDRYRTLVDRNLKQQLSTYTKSKQLMDAMTYSVFNGGKRIRPILVYATNRALNGNIRDADIPACAVEVVHAYSLVHDDLPAMDDDDLRRGKAATHIAYDEATAILAGDALLTMAFEVISNTKVLPACTIAEMVQILSKACGASGMVAGQMIDLESTGKEIKPQTLKSMHDNKTGALIRASVQLGALTANADEQQRSQLDSFASQLGLAFQIRDDILDEIGDENEMGKASGADKELGKSTFVSLFGLDGAKKQLAEIQSSALLAIQSFGTSANELRDVTNFIVDRRF